MPACCFAPRLVAPWPPRPPRRRWEILWGFALLSPAHSSRQQPRDREKTFCSSAFAGACFSRPRQTGRPSRRHPLPAYPDRAATARFPGEPAWHARPSDPATTLRVAESGGEFGVKKAKEATDCSLAPQAALSAGASTQALLRPASSPKSRLAPASRTGDSTRNNLETKGSTPEANGMGAHEPGPLVTGRARCLLRVL